MASHVFNTQKAQEGTSAWGTDPVKLALVGTGYTPDPDADTLLAALGAHELAGDGYSRKTLASKTVTKDATANEARYDAADVVYAGASFGTVKGGIAYREVHASDDAQNIPIAYCELASPVTTNGGDFTFQFGSDGVFKAV